MVSVRYSLAGFVVYTLLVPAAGAEAREAISEYQSVRDVVFVGAQAPLAPAAMQET